MAHSFLLVAEKKEIFPETGLKDPLQYFKQQDLLVHQTITTLTHLIRTVVQFHHHDRHQAIHQAVPPQVALLDQAHLPEHPAEDALLKEDNLYFHFRKNEKISFHSFHVALSKIAISVSI